MTISDETLIAYADGELSGEEMSRVDAALRNDAALQALVERQRALRRHFAAAGSPLLGEAVPAKLLEAVAHARISLRWQLAQTVSRAMRMMTSRHFIGWSAIPAGAALACGVLLGVVLSPQSMSRTDAGGATVMAQGALSSALDRQLASAQTPASLVRIGLSFQAKDGRYCRTFETDGSAAAQAGLACRGSSGWVVAALEQTAPERAAYKMAGAMPDAVRSAVANMIAGAPLDAAGEARARAQGWKTR